MLCNSAPAPAVSQMTADRKGKAVPCRKKMKHEKPSDNDVNTEIEEAIAYETGRMALEKTTDISDNGSGGVTYNHDYTGSAERALP